MTGPHITTAGLTAGLTGEDWHYVGDTDADGNPEPAFENGWVNIASGYAASAFRIREAGAVDLHLGIAGGSGFTVFTLPVGYRPTQLTLIITQAWGGTPGNALFPMVLGIETDGTVELGGPALPGAVFVTGQFFLTPPDVDASTGPTVALPTAPQPWDSDLAAVAALTSPSTIISHATRPLFDHYTDAQSNNTPTETDLYSDTLAAGQLAANGDKLTVRYSGTWTTASRTKRLQFYFGGTALLDTTAITLTSSSQWDFAIDIIRVSSSVIRYAIRFFGNNTGGLVASLVSVAQGEQTGYTLANTQVVKITGLGGAGAATGDITAQSGSIIYTPAA